MENELTDPEVTGEVPPGTEVDPEPEETPEEEVESTEPPAEEPPAEEEEATEETPPEEAATDEETVDEPPEPSDDMQARLDKIEAQHQKRVEKLERRQMYLQRQLEKQARAVSLPEIPETDVKAPKEADFDSIEDYEAALGDYKTQLAVNRELRNYRERAMGDSSQQQMQQFVTDTINEGRSKYEDFEDVAMANTVPITQEMLGVMQELDNPADIAYYLGKNRSECASISNMSREQAIRALTKVEAKVAQALEQKPPAAAAAEPKPKPKKKVSSAPPPVKPTGSSAVVSKDPSKMSQSEYEAWRQQQG